MPLSLLSQERSLNKKAVAEIIGYNERRPQKWEIRVVDATGATELPQYRKILAQGIVRDHGVAQKNYYTMSARMAAVTKRTYFRLARNQRERPTARSRPMLLPAHARTTARRTTGALT